MEGEGWGSKKSENGFKFLELCLLKANFLNILIGSDVMLALLGLDCQIGERKGISYKKWA